MTQEASSSRGWPSDEAFFGLRFFAVLLIASVLFWATDLHLHLGPLQQAIAYLAAQLAQWTGGSVSVRGDNILLESLTLNVNHECTGIFVFLLFAAFVISYPAPWRERLKGLGIGVPLLFIVNVVRLAMLARVVEVYPEAFFYFHEYVWQGIFMVLVLVGGLAWAEQAA